MREFWIVPDESHPEDFGDQYFGDALLSHPNQGPLAWQASLIHVVEKSAFDATIEALKKIIYYVHPDRNRGEHVYPTEFRDEAISVLKRLGIQIKPYAECESETKKALGK